MAIIALEGMRFFAHHGYYEEERILGNEFVLDVYVNAEASLAELTDELYFGIDEEGFPVDDDEEMQPTTVNYETVYLICQAEMRQPSQLLEHVVERISSRIIKHFDNVMGVIVRLKKMNPPLNGRVDASWVMSIEGSIDMGGWEFS